jgi:hypothetical protein
LRATALAILRSAVKPPIYGDGSGSKHIVAATKWALAWDDENLFRQIAQTSASGGADGVLDVLANSMNLEAARDCPDWDQRYVFEVHLLPMAVLREFSLLRLQALTIIINRVGIVASVIKPLEALRKLLIQFQGNISNAAHKASFESWMTKMLAKGADQVLASQSSFEPKDCPLILHMIESRPADWTKNT